MSRIPDKKQYAKMCELYRDWNEKINVISRKDIDNLFEHHILHSLAIREYMSRSGFLEDGLEFFDLGTGGGFPGIPLAFTMPECHFTLCDSIAKKVKVAKAVAKDLKLGNVTCVNARAEVLTGPYDWVISRAVTSLDAFYPWVKGKFRKGILYLKGGDVLSEIEEMCAKCKVDPAKVKVWPINDWLKDDYFAEKFVIEIRK